MHKISTLKNGLTLITVDLPHLDSVTTMIAVGAGSRYETKNINGISHFLEHMFFKGSKKYPTSLEINTLVDSVGAVNNAATSKEFTYYFIKSATKHINLASDILSSMVKESLLEKEEIEREKGVIVEEIRMIKDDPSRHVWDLYERLQFGDQSLGWDIAGSEKTILSLARKDFVNYMSSLYSPKNMVLIYAGNLPKNIIKVAEDYFSEIPNKPQITFKKFQKTEQTKFKVAVHYKKTDQANFILGVEGYSRHNEKKYAAHLLGMILGGGMSSRLFIQIRERNGLAYHISAGHEHYIDTGFFVAFGGLKLEKIKEGLTLVKNELLKTIAEKVTVDELKKVKEMERGRLAIRSESTNFLAEYFGVNFVLDREIETFDEYLKKIDAVTLEDVQDVARELFQKNKFNLQIIGPFKTTTQFEKILNT